MFVLKELLDSKIRFGLVTVAVGLVVSLTMLMSAMSEGLLTGMTGAKRSLQADALVFQGDTQLALERSLVSSEGVDSVARSTGVASSYRVGHAMISVEPSQGSTNVDGTASADTAAFDARLFGMSDRWDQLPIVQGDGGPPGPDETIVDMTAEAEGVSIGDRVRLAPMGRELTVIGFTRDRRYIMVPTFYVDMETWADVHVATALGGRSPRGSDRIGSMEAAPTSRTVGGAASIVAVELEDGFTADRLDAELETFDVATPADAALAGNGMAVMVLATDGIQWVSLVIAALFIGVFFYITTLHKAGQIAAMKALGASNSYLYRQLLLQIAVLVTVAAAIGMLLSLAAGASMPPTMAFDPQPAGWVVSLLAVYFMAFLGSLFSLRSILAIDPATALDRAEH